MATTASDEPSVSAEKVLKRQKKQARREANLMLAIKAAKKDLEKAQKKQSKAQEELRAQSPQVATDETSQSTTDAEVPSLQGEESTLPDGSVVITDATQVDAMQENEAIIVRAPASTTV